jgi:hypothetical protein
LKTQRAIYIDRLKEEISVLNDYVSKEDIVLIKEEKEIEEIELKLIQEEETLRDKRRQLLRLQNPSVVRISITYIKGL